jgi:hypothetical protein
LIPVRDHRPPEIQMVSFGLMERLSHRFAQDRLGRVLVQTGVGMSSLPMFQTVPAESCGEEWNPALLIPSPAPEMTFLALIVPSPTPTIPSLDQMSSVLAQMAPKLAQPISSLVAMPNPAPMISTPSSRLVSRRIRRFKIGHLQLVEDEIARL